VTVLAGKGHGPRIAPLSRSGGAADRSGGLRPTTPADPDQLCWKEIAGRPDSTINRPRGSIASDNVLLRGNIYLQYSPRSRRTASLAGFFDLSHALDGPLR